VPEPETEQPETKVEDVEGSIITIEEPEKQRVRSLPEGIGEDTTHAYIFHHPDLTAAVLRAMMIEESANREDEAEGRSVSPARQVIATFMVALGEEIAGDVLKHMSDDDVERITEDVMRVKEVTNARSWEVLEMVRQRMVAHDYVKTGGIEFARKMLARSAGSRKAGEIVNRVTGVMSAGFAMLNDIEPATLWTLIHNEHPQTVAIILSQLATAQASNILAQMPDEKQSDVVMRIAQMKPVDTETLKRLEESLAESLRGQLSMAGSQSGGSQKAAEILNLAGRATTRNVFKDLEVRDPELVQILKNNMFTFNDIATALDDRAIQRLIQEIDQAELAKALKACANLVKEKFLRNLSSRSREYLIDEIQAMPPTRLSEVEEVQNRIVQIVNQLADAGEISVMRAGAGQEEQFV
jgi:flagellar motor switch protein FliG